jgi:hypothetical protein
MASEAEIKQEIFEIHELFQGWYQGVLAEADLESKMKDGLYRVSYTETQYWYGAGEPSLVIHAVSTLRESLDGVRWGSIYETKGG